MIRGSLDVVGPNHVAGWLYSSAETLNGHIVQAFIGEKCVGAGQIDIHRPDLEAAGLGDGMCGFSFNTTDAVPLEALKVKLEGSDLFLARADDALLDVATPTQNANVVGPTVMTNFERERQLQTYQLMRDKNWVSASEYQFLKRLINNGFFKLDGGADSDVAAAMEKHFGLRDMKRPALTDEALTVETLEERISKMADANRDRINPVLALTFETAVTAQLPPGVHIDDEADEAMMPINLDVAPSDILFLDCQIVKALILPEGTSFTATYQAI